MSDVAEAEAIRMVGASVDGVDADKDESVAATGDSDAEKDGVNVASLSLVLDCSNDSSVKASGAKGLGEGEVTVTGSVMDEHD